MCCEILRTGPLNSSDFTHFVYRLHLVKKSMRQVKKYVSAGGVETLESMKSKYKLTNVRYLVAARGDVRTGEIEEGVEDVESVGVVPLDELVGVVVLNLFPVRHKQSRASAATNKRFPEQEEEERSCAHPDCFTI